MPNTNATMKDHRSLFRQLLAGAYDAIIITDPNGHLLQINPRAREFFLCSDDSYIDRPVSIFIPGVTPDMVKRIRAGLDEARHMMLDAKCVRSDGASFAAEITVSIVDLLDPGDLVFTVRNVERRRRQIETCRTRENAANLAQSALFSCSNDGRFTWVNAAFVELFGLDDAEKACRMSFAEVFDQEPIAQLFQNALAGEQGELRVQAEGDDGDEAIEIRLAPDCHGKRIDGVVGSVFRG